MILGPGWVARFETGAAVPKLDMLLALIHELSGRPDEFFVGLVADESPGEVERFIYAVPSGNDLIVHFKYAAYDAEYRLPDARIEQFETVIKALRDGLARDNKTKAVVSSFLTAVKLWPNVNPSDLWWFVIHRAYCDPFNHPAANVGGDLAQSWKRTGGWALEEILVQFYAPHLEQHGIRVFIATGPQKDVLLGQLQVQERLESDKVDILLTASVRGKEQCFGVVHVKASLAERRTDDVPLSHALVTAGYVSPLWTMDCKGLPAAQPTNPGELGEPLGTADLRSAKRKDIEDDGYFSACFSYNRNTKPTPVGQKVKARIVVCDFQSPDDAFSKFIISEWKKRRRSAGS